MGSADPMQLASSVLSVYASVLNSNLLVPLSSLKRVVGDSSLVDLRRPSLSTKHIKQADRRQVQAFDLTRRHRTLSLRQVQRIL
ncbi:hypothetical protein NliqN6_6436 [Naganishia liquefaciens]|uniref:Uncharacterized protein n=1 Tax=Naganishia liquefaciens TaxID=104408 RepID=A0A8H3U075_9TREE|nr:hypothetical protein NliqN6_6436 [Naganishia liquefaciens]